MKSLPDLSHFPMILYMLLVLIHINYKEDEDSLIKGGTNYYGWSRRLAVELGWHKLARPRKDFGCSGTSFSEKETSFLPILALLWQSPICCPLPPPLSLSALPPPVLTQRIHQRPHNQCDSQDNWMRGSIYTSFTHTKKKRLLRCSSMVLYRVHRRLCLWVIRGSL